MLIFLFLRHVDHSAYTTTLETFRSEDEDDYEYEFSVLNMRIRFGGRRFSKSSSSSDLKVPIELEVGDIRELALDAIKKQMLKCLIYFCR